MQMLLSATLKSHGRIIWAVTLDGGLFTVLVLYCGWLWLHTGAVYSVSVMFTFLGVYALVLLAVCGYSLRQHFADFAWVRYREAVKFGIPLIISGFLIMLLAGSMRVFIEHFLGLEQVALYAFYFRLAAVVIMIHQVVNIALFQKIYQAAPATLDKFFALFLLFIGIISVLSCFIVPIFATNYFRLMHESIATHHKLYLLLSVQMVFWVSAALNENIIYREGLATKMNWGFGLLVPVMLGAMAGFNAMGWLNIFTITLINIVVLYLGVEVQLYVLRTQKIYFPKVRLVNIAALCLMFFLYFWAL